MQIKNLNNMYAKPLLPFSTFLLKLCYVIQKLTNSGEHKITSHIVSCNRSFMINPLPDEQQFYDDAV
jgi:hypothetical protein